MAQFTITDQNLPRLAEFYGQGEYIWGNLQDVYKFITDQLQYSEEQVELRSRAFTWIVVLSEVISHMKTFDPEKGGDQ